MRRTVGLTLLLVVLAIGVGSVVAVQTFPSKGQLQRMSFESLGLDPRFLNVPFVQEIVNETSGRVQDRVVDKARTSALEGGLAALVIAVVGAVLIEMDRRRRPHEASAPAADPTPPAAAAAPPVVPPPPPPPPPPGAPANPV